MNIKINSNFEKVEVNSKFEIIDNGDNSVVTILYGDKFQNKSSVSCSTNEVDFWKNWLTKRIQNTIQMHNLFGTKLAGI